MRRPCLCDRINPETQEKAEMVVALKNALNANFVIRMIPMSCVGLYEELTVTWRLVKWMHDGCILQYKVYWHCTVRKVSQHTSAR